MRLDTTRFGVLEVTEEDLITFPVGIPGFPDMRKYVLVKNSEGHIFHIMQSVDDPALAFILIDPVLFVADYKVEVEKDEVAELQLTDDDEAVIMAIVTVPRDNPGGMTANLQAPIVLNPRTRLGRQVVLPDSPYSIRHRLLPDPSAGEGTATGLGPSDVGEGVATEPGSSDAGEGAAAGSARARADDSDLTGPGHSDKEAG